jgi:hypothetical protein
MHSSQLLAGCEAWAMLVHGYPWWAHIKRIHRNMWILSNQSIWRRTRKKVSEHDLRLRAFSWHISILNPRCGSVLFFNHMVAPSQATLTALPKMYTFSTHRTRLEGMPTSRESLAVLQPYADSYPANSRTNLFQPFFIIGSVKRQDRLLAAS